MPVVILTEDNFDSEVICSRVPVLVSFGGVEPAFSSANNALGGVIKFGKINAGEQTELLRKYRIWQVPTMLLFRDGKVNDTIVGGIDAEQLLKILQ